MQRRPFLLAALMAASFLPALAGASAGDPQVAVRNKIEVESVNGRALVHLTVYNYGKQTIWIPREMAEEKELTGRRFDVRAFDGRPLDYTGKMVKRAALTAADYVPIAPGKEVRNTIDITPSYAFLKGRHSYQIGYDGPYLADVKQLDKPAESPARPLTFIHTGH
ncbi:MAG: hypothetical protein AB1584_16695 [Pseudomonadota bacterium]